MASIITVWNVAEKRFLKGINGELNDHSSRNEVDMDRLKEVKVFVQKCLNKEQRENYGAYAFELRPPF